MFSFLKQKERKIQVELICPDGFSEWLSYDFPSQIDQFITFINRFSPEGYKFRLREFDIYRTIGELTKG